MAARFHFLSKPTALVFAFLTLLTGCYSRSDSTVSNSESPSSAVNEGLDAETITLAVDYSVYDGVDFEISQPPTLYACSSQTDPCELLSIDRQGSTVCYAFHIPDNAQDFTLLPAVIRILQNGDFANPFSRRRRRNCRLQSRKNRNCAERPICRMQDHRYNRNKARVVSLSAFPTQQDNQQFRYCLHSLYRRTDRKCLNAMRLCLYTGLQRRTGADHFAGFHIPIQRLSAVPICEKRILFSAGTLLPGNHKGQRHNRQILKTMEFDDKFSE